MAEGLNDFSETLNATVDDSSVLRLNPFTGVVWQVSFASKGQCLNLAQFAQTDGGKLTAIHVEKPFSFGEVIVELGATDADAQVNFVWLMSKLAVTYIHMLQDPQAQSEEGFNVFEVMGKAAQFKPFSEIACQIHGLNSIEELAPIYDVRAPYRFAN
jgi:hypothetical protein